MKKVFYFLCTALLLFSCAEDEMVVDKGDHAYVDLGLSVKWATCNVGADRPEEYGAYFAWGETKPKYTYDDEWSNYKWYNISSETFTKYCSESEYGIVDNKTQLDLSDDAAHVNWGKPWRMPTHDELTELHTKCTWTWTTQNGVNGYLVTSNINGNTIFLPAAGSRDGNSLDGEGETGWYWSSSLGTDGPFDSWCVIGELSDVELDDYERNCGLSVRPVRP